MYVIDKDHQARLQSDDKDDGGGDCDDDDDNEVDEEQWRDTNALSSEVQHV